MENTNDMIPIIHATYLNGGYVSCVASISQPIAISFS